MTAYANLLIGQGRREMALNDLFRALDMYRDALGTDSEHPEMVTAMNLIRFLQGEGNESASGDSGSTSNDNANVQESEQ